MRPPQIVIDTNVFISALRSKRGAAYRLLNLLGRGSFEINISVPLILEYEDVAKRLINELPLTTDDIDDIIDYICTIANHRKVYYVWRPFLKDAKDDMVLELAVTGNCDLIVSFNKRDFQGIDQFGIRVLSAQEFLKEIGALQ